MDAVELVQEPTCGIDSTAHLRPDRDESSARVLRVVSQVVVVVEFLDQAAVLAPGLGEQPLKELQLLWKGSALCLCRTAREG